MVVSGGHALPPPDAGVMTLTEQDLVPISSHLALHTEQVGADTTQSTLGGGTGGHGGPWHAWLL